MKRILHDGADRYRARCGECGCEFTYDRSDVGHNYVTGGDHVGCPHCGRPVRHFGARSAVKSAYCSDAGTS